MDVFTACIEAVERKLQSALSGADPKPRIAVSPVDERAPFGAYVIPTPGSVTISDRSTSSMGASGARGCYRVEFNVQVELVAVRADHARAAAIVLGWYEELVKAVAVDKTLGGLCIHAEPFMDVAATGDRDAQAIAAIDCGVSIKAEIDPTK